MAQAPLKQVYEDTPEEQQLKAQRQAKQFDTATPEGMDALTQSLIKQKQAGADLTGMDAQLLRAAKLRDTPFNADGFHQTGGIGSAMSAFANVLDRRDGRQQYDGLEKKALEAKRLVASAAAAKEAREMRMEDEKVATGLSQFQAEQAVRQQGADAATSNAATNAAQVAGVAERAGLAQARQQKQDAQKGKQRIGRATYYRPEGDPEGPVLEVWQHADGSFTGDGEPATKEELSEALYGWEQGLSPKELAASNKSAGGGRRGGNKALGQPFIKSTAGTSHKINAIGGLIDNFDYGFGQIDGIPTGTLNRWFADAEGAGLGKLGEKFKFVTSEQREQAQQQLKYRADLEKFVHSKHRNDLFGSALTVQENRLFQMGEDLLPGQDPERLRARLVHIHMVLRQRQVDDINDALAAREGTPDAESLRRNAERLGVAIREDGLLELPFTREEYDANITDYYSRGGGYDKENRLSGRGLGAGATTDSTEHVVDIEDPDMSLDELEALAAKGRK